MNYYIYRIKNVLIILLKIAGIAALLILIGIRTLDYKDQHNVELDKKFIKEHSRKKIAFKTIRKGKIITLIFETPNEGYKIDNLICFLHVGNGIKMGELKLKPRRTLDLSINELAQIFAMNTGQRMRLSRGLNLKQYKHQIPLFGIKNMQDNKIEIEILNDYLYNYLTEFGTLKFVVKGNYFQDSNEEAVSLND